MAPQSFIPFWQIRQCTSQIGAVHYADFFFFFFLLIGFVSHEQTCIICEFANKSIFFLSRESYTNEDFMYQSDNNFIWSMSETQILDNWL